MASASAVVLPPPFVLRELDPDCAADVEWVARGMHLTLVEVEGEKGRAAYPVEWTRARLRELAGRRRFLNLFAYTGTATVYAASGGALATTTVDMSRVNVDEKIGSTAASIQKPCSLA